MKIIVINGPNINLLGKREKEIYGAKSYEDFCQYIRAEAEAMGIDVQIFQSNIEGEIIDQIQKSEGLYEGIVINPAAYSHYSIGILDALKAIEIPSVEVHISNIQDREEFRKHSLTASGSIGQISGFGIYGYILALRALKETRL